MKRLLALSILALALVGAGWQASGNSSNTVTVSNLPDQTAFGEQSVAELTPQVQLEFGHGSLHPLIVDQRLNSGTATIADSQLVLSTGAGANQSAGLLSTDVVKYNPGQGSVARFTAIFTAGAANSVQEIGVGDLEDGYFFQMNGTAMGIMRRFGGEPEVRTITVTTGSSTAENITITLNAVAEATVAVTNTGDTTLTANEIAAHDFSNVGRGWRTEAVGSTVVFLSYDSGDRSGTCSLSGASTAIGTCAQTLAGIAATEVSVAQASWNVDAADGTGDLPVIDFTKGNVFQIKYRWLGYGGINFSIEHPVTGRYILVHRIEYANAFTRPSTNNPSFHISALVANTSNTTDIVLKSGSLMGGTEGRYILSGPVGAADATLGSVSTTLLPVFTLHNGVVFNGLLNRIEVKLTRLGLAVDHTKPMTFEIYEDATLTGASFSAVNSDSVMEIDTSATAMTGGKLLASIALGKEGNQPLEFLREHEGLLPPGHTVTIGVKALSGTGGDADASINWIELF